MKLSWMRWSVLPAAVLLVGGVARAQDQSSSGSPSSSQGGEAAAPAPAEKTRPTVAQRKENQQDRINKEHAASRNIYCKKHNTKTQPGAQPE